VSRNSATVLPLVQRALGVVVRMRSRWMRPVVEGLLAGSVCVVLAGCGQTEGGVVSAGDKPLSKQAMQLLGTKDMQPQAPIFIRIFKEESELEVWKSRADGRFYHFKTYPICNWSGELGPKLQTGDKQAPEGFYTVANRQLNPRSQFYLSFNLGFPNAYDKAYGRSGDALMVHGDCKSAGCYAMTDALVEEIYALARDALAGGQSEFAVHAFPFRMTPENMNRHASSQWVPFWKTLKDGYDHFELSRQVPPVAVCNKSYVVNASFAEGAELNPAGPCPAYKRGKPDLFVENVEPKANKKLMARVIAPGKKLRTPWLPPVEPDATAVAGAPAEAAPDGSWTDPQTFSLNPEQ
jgi:murein L,D-transpeptidase YafK